MSASCLNVGSFIGGLVGGYLGGIIIIYKPESKSQVQKTKNISYKSIEFQFRANKRLFKMYCVDLLFLSLLRFISYSIFHLSTKYASRRSRLLLFS